MNIFKVIYSYFYCLFVKMSYHLVYKNKKEAIYHNRKKSKYIIDVKDPEIGKRLYEVAEFLKMGDGTTLINTLNAKLKFTNYGLICRNRVKWFCVEGCTLTKWENLSNLEKLKEMQTLVDAMQDKGFVLDRTKFNCSGCSSASEFMSFFIQSDEKDKIEQSKGCMIQYIHYVLSNGGNLSEFYEDFSNKGICEGYKIPYNSLVAQMCYNYFKTGVTPDSIYDTLTDSAPRGGYENFSLILLPDKLESKFKVTENTDEYTIYDGCLKIYSNMPSDYKEYLADKGRINQSNIATFEQIEAIIVDLDNNIIGYKFANQDKQYVQEVLKPDLTLNSQNDIFKYVIDIVKYLEKYNQTRKNGKTKSNDFEIEKHLVLVSQVYDFNFKSNTIKELFNLTTKDWGKLEKQVTVLFFKLLANYMAKKYGELNSKEQFLEKVEVRFLSPIVASEFVNFALGKPVDYKAGSKELFKLFYNRKISKKASFSYDTRFCYDPLNVHIAFDYEAVKKYNAKLEKGTAETLPDGRTLVTFKRSQRISTFMENEKSMIQSIRSKLGHIEDEHVKLVGISEIIVGTQRLNSDNMYNVVGYVVESLKGEQITVQSLVNLNNRDLLKVAGYLFSKFNEYYIPWNNIWMDNDFVFYINYMDESFQVKKNTGTSRDSATFVQSVFDHLVRTGYNPNAFVGWKLRCGGGYKATKNYLLNLANSFDAYCDEHKIYYDSKYGQCPVCAQTKYLVPQNFEETLTKVFEDSIAVHYSIDKTYNLKVYKPEYKGKVDANVSRLISLRLSYNDEDLGFFQDCFLPCKWALDSNKQIVGYVYETVKFETINGDTSDVCVDLEDGEKLRNLHRLKSLIRLILQVKEITNKNLGFVMNPFSHVFLNRSHKKQVQILNIEFICSCNPNDLRKTKQWTYDYIYKVLRSDPTIEFNCTAFPEGLDSLLSKLTELAEQMSKYCTIHKMYYKSSHVYCPKCVDPINQPKNIQYTSKSRYEAKTPINEGGEAFIYSHSKGIVAKVFKEGNINKDFKNNVLFRILSKKDILEKVNRENHKYKYVIPKEILIDSKTNEIFGYTMDWVENAFPISSLRDKIEVKKLGLSKEDIFEIIITIGEGIQTLHKVANIYIGDLNGRNILFDSRKNVYFLDFDGMGIDEVAPEFCTDGYIDPLSKKNQKITMKDDWYSFAVQAFYYLTYTHPFNGIYYEVRNGRKVMLDVPDKMERRISLLGNHGMKAPAIAVPWNWMNAELKSAFLNIFEGDYRESIVPQLKKQYQALSTNNNLSNNAYRINSKFVATELEAFDGKVVRVINPYAAICENANGRHLAILSNYSVQVSQKNLYISDLQAIDDCMFSEDGKIVFIVYDKNKVVGIDLERQEVIYHEDIPEATNVVVNDRTIYFTGILKENIVIFKRTFHTNGSIEKETIGVGNQNIKWFNVKFNTKFILIKQANENTDEVYCNSEKFFAFEYNSAEIAKQARYNIVYDEVTKSWIVVNNFGKGIVIRMSGGSTEVEMSSYINDGNFANIYYEKGNIYIPSAECMYIVNVSSKVAKKMECHKIMDSDSKLYDINSNGFSVITNKVFYEVRKG